LTFGLTGSNRETHDRPGHLAARKQFSRYVLVGGFNTLFGYTCFFLIYRWLSTFLPYAYVWATLISSLINITVAFLGYKKFVFRTRGGYLREWLRTLTVYSGGILISTLAIGPLVALVRHTTPYQSHAPYIAAAMLTVFNLGASFLGHRHFSFRNSQSI
jgi:putative flippase GtrA